MTEQSEFEQKTVEGASVACTVKNLLSRTERLLIHRPVLTTICGGVLAYLIAFGIPLLISLEYRLKMSEGPFSLAVILLFGLTGSFLVVYTHWAIAKFCRHFWAQVLNFMGAMVFPAIMFSGWASLMFLQGMD